MASRFQKAKMWTAEKMGPGKKGRVKGMKGRAKRGAALLGAFITGKETTKSAGEIRAKWGHKKEPPRDPSWYGTNPPVRQPAGRGTGRAPTFGEAINPLKFVKEAADRSKR